MYGNDQEDKGRTTARRSGGKCSLMIWAQISEWREQERTMVWKWKCGARTRMSPSGPVVRGTWEKAGHHSEGLQGVQCPRDKAKFPSELEGVGAIQRRVWVEDIFLRTEQYGDKDFSDEIWPGKLVHLKVTEISTEISTEIRQDGVPWGQLTRGDNSF